jgi:sugar phosphate isomerase/epimerase
VDAGLAPLTVGRPKPLTLVRAAAAAGFRWIGVTLWEPGGEPDDLCSDTALRRSMQTQLACSGVSVRDMGVVVLSPHLDLSPVHRMIEAGRALDAERLLVMNRDDTAGSAAAGLSAVCEAAAPAGITVAVEFAPYTCTPDLPAALELLSATGRSDVGLVLDVLHLYRSGGSAEQLSGLDRDVVHLLQLCDARAVPPPRDQLRVEALTDRLYPGEGDLPLLEIVQTLPGIPITVEAPVARDAGRTPQERAIRAAAATRALLSRA